MIINTGARSDTVALYSKWLLNRFKEGYVLVRNPLFPSKITRYELNPKVVDCVVFCSKNYKPILPHLHQITQRFPTYFHYTITGYEEDIEPRVPKISKSIQTLIELSKLVGKQRIAWRYDPILLTPKYDISYHIKTFREIALSVAPYIDRCIFSFVEMYKRLDYLIPDLIALSEEDKDILAKNLGGIAKELGIHLQTCGKSGDFSSYGISHSACVTLKVLAQANDLEFKELKHKGLREGCGCVESRDIGIYDSCSLGCKYCYANKNPQKSMQNYKTHDPNSPLLLGEVREGDTITQGVQKSFLKPKQTHLFDLGGE